MKTLDKFEMSIIRFALFATLALASVSGLAAAAFACPKGTHPVCTYNPADGRSHCHCVSEVDGVCKFN